MEDFYVVHDIRQIIYAEEEHPFIELTTHDDWQYYFYVGQPLIAVTEAGENIKGVLSVVEYTFFKIKTDSETEVSITYIEIKSFQNIEKVV